MVGGLLASATDAVGDAAPAGSRALGADENRPARSWPTGPARVRTGPVGSASLAGGRHVTGSWPSSMSHSPCPAAPTDSGVATGG
ncbi:hypothetical protein BKA18_007110 [Streptomyces auratus]